MTIPDYRRLEELGRNLTRPATDDEFRAAVLAAWEALCHGTFDAYVRRFEPWENAITFEAGRFLMDSGLGREVGQPSDVWDDIVKTVARGGSCAPDRMVQAYAPVGHPGAMRVPISALSRGV